MRFGLFQGVDLGVFVSENGGDVLGGLLVKGQDGWLCHGVAAVLAKGIVQILYVGILPHFGATALLGGHQMEHTVGGAVKHVVVDAVIGRHVGITPAFDVGGGVGVVALLSPTVAGAA